MTRGGGAWAGSCSGTVDCSPAVGIASDEPTTNPTTTKRVSIADNTTRLEVTVRTFLLEHRRHVNGSAVVALALVTSIGVARVAVIAQGNPAAAKVSKPVPVSPESIAAGKRVYTRYCAVCHGTNGEGGSGSDISAPAPDLTDKEWKHGSTDGEVFDVIKNGVPPALNMEPWGDRIEDPDIWNVVNYVRTLAKK
jgi:mono/diheme cytochrome c family protein